MAFFLFAASDPVISTFEADNDDENKSYWMMEQQKQQQQQQQQQSWTKNKNKGIISEVPPGGGKQQHGIKLRNAHKHSTNENGIAPSSSADAAISHDHHHHHHLPDYSKIVIVGGGMAGLHTALALAERINDPNCRNVNPPSSSSSSSSSVTNIRTKKRRWWPGWLPTTKKTLQSTQESHQHHSANNDANNKSEIIVLDASRIGNGSSGRAKGLVVPGFQVPLENLRENASDYYASSSTGVASSSSSSSSSSWSWTVPAIVQSLSRSPRYTKAVVEEMYDLSYGAMDRLRDIVSKYEIDCDWVESGVVEGGIHTLEDDDDEEEEEDGCQMLTWKEVNEIMGRRPTTSPGSSDNDNRNLYRWGEYDPSCAGVNPLALTNGLADAAERWGVRIYEHARVAKLEKLQQITMPTSPQQQQQQCTSAEPPLGKYAIVTDDGRTVRCDRVVLCTGAERLSDDVSRRLKHSTVPVYTWMAATEPLGERCPLKDDGVVDRVLSSSSSSSSGSSGSANTHDGSDVMGRPAPMCGDDHISLNYWRRNDDKNDTDEGRGGKGRLLFGSLADTYPFPEWMVSLRLRSALTEVYPQLSHHGDDDDVRFDNVWGGKLAFALNAMPLVGRDSDYDDDDHRAGNGVDGGGVWYATGFAGHGIVPTALAGSLLADAMLGNEHGERRLQLFQTYFPPTSWNGYPFSRLGTGAVLLVYNAWDWMSKKGVPLPPLPKLW